VLPVIAHADHFRAIGEPKSPRPAHEPYKRINRGAGAGRCPGDLNHPKGGITAMRATNRISAAVALACTGLALASTAGAVDVRDWGKQYPSSERFVVLSQFGDTAVLDKETQLVWERTPSTTTLTWGSAFATCLPKSIGGRKGWRLPTAEELTSLHNASVLPPGHPFLGVQYEAFWTATSHPDFDAAFTVFGTGGSTFHLKSTSHRAWCVRGSQGYDGR
jgi:hypothetical protein